MKILWFTHIPVQQVLRHNGLATTGTGFWIHSLVTPLSLHADISRLGVVYAGADCPDEHFEADSVNYYTIRQSKLAAIYGLGQKRDEERCLDKFVSIIEEFRPDLIHIHGTERFYGLLKVYNLTNVPTVVSIQGLMGPCAKFAWGDKGFWDMLKLQGKWDAVRGFPSLKSRRRFIDRAKLECEILRSVDGVIGRSAWDKFYIRSVASEQRYFHVDEMIRSEFFSEQWSVKSCQRHRIYTSGRLTFAKGMHIFIEAMALLKREYPDLSVRIAGSNPPSAEYRYLRRQVKKLGLSGNVDFIGWISGPEIVKELKSAHVYANSSFIENSPNSVCEAMLMGAPSVCGAVGGIPSMMQDRTEGLLVQPGKPSLLAFAICELFENDDLSVSLGQSARQLACRRHNPKTIIDDLLNCYQKIVNKS